MGGTHERIKPEHEARCRHSVTTVMEGPLIPPPTFSREASKVPGMSAAAVMQVLHASGVWQSGAGGVMEDALQAMTLGESHRDRSLLTALMRDLEREALLGGRPVDLSTTAEDVNSVLLAALGHLADQSPGAALRWTVQGTTTVTCSGCKAVAGRPTREALWQIPRGIHYTSLAKGYGGRVDAHCRNCNDTMPHETSTVWGPEAPPAVIFVARPDLGGTQLEARFGGGRYIMVAMVALLNIRDRQPGEDGGEFITWRRHGGAWWRCSMSNACREVGGSFGEIRDTLSGNVQPVLACYQKF